MLRGRSCFHHDRPCHGDGPYQERPMSVVAIPLSTLATSHSWQKNFLAVLPAVQNHAAVCFRHLQPEARAEATAHAIAAACVSYHPLSPQHNLARPSAGSLPIYAFKPFKGGRHVGGHMS